MTTLPENPVNTVEAAHTKRKQVKEDGSGLGGGIPGRSLPCSTFPMSVTALLIYMLTRQGENMPAWSILEKTKDTRYFQRIFLDMDPVWLALSLFRRGHYQKVGGRIEICLNHSTNQCL